MQCPKCDHEMEPVMVCDITVDRCTRCQGIWFDRNERERLRSISGSELIDRGDARLGKKFNKKADIDCPVCRSRMVPMVDADQPHIWYEACSCCQGAFFDAGEFADYKDLSLMDFFRDLNTPERG